jgi:nucleotide-binding universal stress UspA family protein
MYKHIMVPLDGSELAECVLPHGEAIARGCGASKVSFVRVVTAPHVYVGEGVEATKLIERLLNESTAAAAGYLEKLVQGLEFGQIETQPVILYGSAAEKLADYAAKNSVDLIIIATHGRSGVSRWVRGKRSRPHSALSLRPGVYGTCPRVYPGHIARQAKRSIAPG